MRSLQKRIATGVRRIGEPLPLLFGSVDPARITPIDLQRCSACRVVVPISKQLPVQE
jgi:hypothetical protein